MKLNPKGSIGFIWYKFFILIWFEEETHGYFYDGIRLSSVTSEIGNYSEKFDKDYQSSISAYKELLGDAFLEIRKKVFGFDFKPSGQFLFPLFDQLVDKSLFEETKEKYKADWEGSSTRGTEFHLQREKESIERGYEVNPFTEKEFPVITFEKQYHNQVFDMDLFKLPDGFHSELLVYDNALPLNKTVCGQIDKLWIETIGDKRYVDTDDYKTNKDTLKEHKYSRMLPPLDHLWSNSIVKYSLQASWYQMMLESHGFVIRNAAFTHYENYDVNKSKMYPVIVMKDEINLIREDILKRWEV